MKIVLGLFGVSALVVGSATALDLRFNWTASMPRGVYREVTPSLERGAWVAVCLEGAAAALARERGYVIEGSCASGLMPVFKRIAAVPGDRVAVARDAVAVNGERIAGSDLHARDSQGRALKSVADGEFALESGRYFVMGLRLSRSWDSRYFGPVSEHQIVAGAEPVWTF